MKRILAIVPAAAALVLFAIKALAVQGIDPLAAAGTPVVLDGTISMLVEDDFLHGRSTVHHFLDDAATGMRLKLKLNANHAGRIETGAKVRVSGVLSGDEVTLDESAFGVTILKSAAAATATPAGARKVLILLVDIVDSGGVKHAIATSCDGSGQSASEAFGTGTGGGSVDLCYQQSSYGALGFGGASYPGTASDVQRVTINDAVDACNYTAWGTKADAAASNLSGYVHRVYVVPSDVNCGWAGLGYISACPGSYCQAWVKAYSSRPCGYPDAVAHEVGHNLGLMHSSTDTNNDGTLDCEYCDDSDFMGYAEGNQRTLNGPHRVQMGWVAGGGIVDASAGGTFTLAPLNSASPSFPQVARIARGGDPYYLSYRDTSGYDNYLLGTYYSPNVVGETSIHRWPGGVTNTRIIGSLGDGDTFTDSANSLTIVQTSHGPSGATFTVYVGITPPTNLKAAAGNAQVSLTWSASAGATGYNVKRGGASGGPYTTIQSIGTATSYTDSAVANGTTYYYVVSALASGGAESADSAQVTATPQGVDLAVTAVSNPPSAAAPGSTFSGSDTVKNQGGVTAGASTVRYYLSHDKAKDAGDWLLGATRSVASLAAGATSSGSVTLTVPSGIAAGTYYLLACADDLNVVAETNEANNCLASATTVQVALPDLVVTAVGNPPALAAAGDQFNVTFTVKNQGNAASAASTLRFYLSADTQKDGSDVLLTGTKSVNALTAGQSSASNTNVTIPSGAATGTYFVLACADDLGAVAESSESNNCLASADTVQVTRPDLVVTAVGNPPASVARGGTINATSTVKNQGAVTASASTTRYYLSLNPLRDAADILLTGTKAVNSLAAGASANANANAKVPSNSATGTYYLLSCADDLDAVAETDESNNCKASATTVVVK